MTCEKHDNDQFF